MPALWRVVKRVHAATAFDGKAAGLFGGRWNSAGRRAVYASGSKSLALLEMLVHLDVGRPLPRFVAFRFEVDEKLLDRLSPAKLPRDWRTSRGLLATQALGDAWLRSVRALALAVPSVIVPEETNFVLNPAHPAFARMKTGAAMPVELDRRLTRR